MFPRLLLGLHSYTVFFLICYLESFLGLKFQTLFHLNFTRIIENINLQGIFFPKNQPKLSPLVPTLQNNQLLWAQAPVAIQNKECAHFGPEYV